MRIASLPTWFMMVCVVWLAACKPVLMINPPFPPPPPEALGQVLDDFHAAASKADFERYFAHLDESAVFLGTDPKERWTKAQFAEYCKPYFDQGKGWTYVPVDRHIEVVHRVAYFDEVLRNEKYGLCRGSGVAIEANSGSWKIRQYNLTFLVPNEESDVIVQMWAKLPRP